MRSFQYYRATDCSDAVVQIQAANNQIDMGMFLGGGTTLLDLMKLDVLRPQRLVDISGLSEEFLRVCARTSNGLRIGALVTMEELANNVEVIRDFPLLAESLSLSASGQLRNMARLGGNVLQRTRCSYYRDVSFEQCNRRTPGTGCAALDGMNRNHAILGTSNSCIATYPGDWAVALIAMDAYVEIRGLTTSRIIPFSKLHRLPGSTPHIETSLGPDEMITSFLVQGGPWPRSRYVKVRDRQSYAFASASTAVALDMRGDEIAEVRIALGGFATVPWRAFRAEQVLLGGRLTEAIAAKAAEAEITSSAVHAHNAFKVPLGRATLVRALLEARDMELSE